MDAIEIRTCTDRDLEVLRTRWPSRADVHGSHHARQMEGAATYLVAWRGDEPLGVGMVQWGGCLGPEARAAFPGAVEINHVQVREEFRGQGVGTSLIGAAENLAVRQGRTQVAIAVNDENPEAARLYARLGYAPTGVLDVSEYDWTDDDGVVHHAIERDQLLVKELTTLALSTSD